MKYIDVLLGFVVVVVALTFAWIVWMAVTDMRTSHTAPAPTFTCAQTISADSAAILSADLWDRASRGERTRIVFGCREGRTLIRMERVR